MNRGLVERWNSNEFIQVAQVNGLVEEVSGSADDLAGAPGARWLRLRWRHR